MNEHYYTSSPESAHQYETCTLVYRGENLRFTTDAGVFSRGEIDFGTKTLMNALPEELSGRGLDLGCGWGAVGVTVGKKWPGCPMVMSDVNERAVGLARQNAEANGVSAEVIQSDGLENVPGNFDFILTNPPIRAGKETIYRLFRESADRLVGGGSLYLVIRKQQGAESAIRYLKTIFVHVETIDKSGGFWVIRCTNGEKTHEV